MTKQEQIDRLIAKVAESGAEIVSRTTKPAMGIMFPELEQFRVRRADGQEMLYSIDPKGKLIARVPKAR